MEPILVRHVVYNDISILL